MIQTIFMKGIINVILHTLLGRSFQILGTSVGQLLQKWLADLWKTKSEKRENSRHRTVRVTTLGAVRRISQ